MDANIINSAENLIKVQTTLQKHGISFSVLIMIALLEYEESNLSDICSKINITPSAMTTVKDKAELLGFIQEYVIEDRRKKLYGITDTGRELLAGIRQ